RWRRSVTPRRRRTGPSPPGCSPTAGLGCTWTARPPSSTSCSASSPPEQARRMRSWPQWPRATSWPPGRWGRGTAPLARRGGGRGWALVPEGRRGQARLLVGMVRLLLARQRGNRPVVAEEAGLLQAAAEAPEAAQPVLGEELRALALISLGSAEYWAARFEDAERYLGQGVAL